MHYETIFSRQTLLYRVENLSVLGVVLTELFKIVIFVTAY